MERFVGKQRWRVAAPATTLALKDPLPAALRRRQRIDGAALEAIVGRIARGDAAHKRRQRPLQRHGIGFARKRGGELVLVGGVVAQARDRFGQRQAHLVFVGDRFEHERFEARRTAVPPLQRAVTAIPEGGRVAFGAAAGDALWQGLGARKAVRGRMARSARHRAIAAQIDVVEQALAEVKHRLRRLVARGSGHRRQSHGRRAQRRKGRLRRLLRWLRLLRRGDSHDEDHGQELGKAGA
ncbi:MAG: hypothetical protein V9E94_07585, partial [Microthrixaceae bacterium]